MKHLWHAPPALLIGIAAACVAAGCGRGDRVHGVRVAGQVLENGRPIKFLPGEEIMVGFSSEVPAGQKPIGTFASVNPEDGTFLITGPTNEGIPACNYRVSLSSQIYGSTSGDRFETVFDDKRPPLIAEVGTEKGQAFLIDLGTWTVKKQ